jgi:hypothetical protein
MIIAVDFDGTICDDDGEIEGAIDALTHARTRGHQIILWTCRGERALCDAVDWCKLGGLKFDAINACTSDSSWYSHPKVFADVYIDDKSFPPFTNWSDFRIFIDAGSQKK